MQRAYKNLRGCIFKGSPLALRAIKDKHLTGIANSYLPYSTGMEIECEWKPEHTRGDDFSGYRYNPVSVPGPQGVIAMDNDSAEKRFRIKPGIDGMLALWNISAWMKKNCLLNPGSGIHYHIDCTDLQYECVLAYMKDKKRLRHIISQLEQWNYKGLYNKKEFSAGSATWFRWNEPLSTLEFRIGEMTFEYSVMIKRIIHCQIMVRAIKKWVRKNMDVVSQRPKSQKVPTY